MTDDNGTFADDAWSDDRIEAAYQQRQNDDGGDKSDFAKRVEEIREKRDESDGGDNEESLDEAVERLSGRVFRVKYPDPADPNETKRQKIIADNIQPTAAGMVFHRKTKGKASVFPAPVKFEELSDDRIRSWVKGQRKLMKMLEPFTSLFGGNSD